MDWAGQALTIVAVSWLKCSSSWPQVQSLPLSFGIWENPPFPAGLYRSVYISMTDRDQDIMSLTFTALRFFQGPLLMQSVLSPIVGRLSDVLDRKYLAAVPPLIAFVGAVVSAKATSMSMLVGGGILIGPTLATIAIVQAIPSEILPLKYRALANGFSFMGGAVGGL